MQIYLAGKWADRDIVSERITDIEALGHTITHDWTRVDNCHNSLTELAYCSLLDTKGVTSAELVIFLIEDPEYAYRDTFTELGIALGQNQLGFHKDIWIVCPHSHSKARNNVFFHHPVIRHLNSWDVALKVLEDYPLSPRSTLKEYRNNITHAMLTFAEFLGREELCQLVDSIKETITEDYDLSSDDSDETDDEDGEHCP